MLKLLKSLRLFLNRPIICFDKSMFYSIDLPYQSSSNCGRNCYPPCFQTFFISHRGFATAQTATALKSFYFAVHPDFFGQYPAERAINENSLKYLNSYLDSLINYKYVQPIAITFFLRNNHKATISNLTQSNVSWSPKQVTINLISQDVRTTIQHVLESCNMSTQHLDAIQFPSNPNITWDDKIEDIFGRKIHSKHFLSLRDWLQQNSRSAQEKQARSCLVKQENWRLVKELRHAYSVGTIHWQSGSNSTIFNGCLKELERIFKEHPNFTSVVREKHLIFNTINGISWRGEICLDFRDVPEKWIMLLQYLRANEADVWHMVKEINRAEKKLSNLLGDLQIVHPKNLNSLLTADHYHTAVTQLATQAANFDSSLRKGSISLPPPTALNQLEAVIECDPGRLELSQSGQILIPLFCPVESILSLADKRKEEAISLLQIHKKDLTLEKKLVSDCLLKYGLKSLRRDSSISPQQMIHCCQSLMEYTSLQSGNSSLENVHLWITPYYSVLNDGEMCVPWDWLLRV